MKINQHYRMVDANINRLKEGLRVVEDLCRFSMDRQDAATRLKDIRHQVEVVWAPLSDLLLSARDVVGDQGIEVSGAGEYRRSELRDILGANLSRAQESARSLEEMSKWLCPSQAKVLERMRYELYDLEKDLLSGDPQFPRHCLYVLVTQSLCKLAPKVVLEAVCRGGADVVQLREKDMEDGAFLEWIREAKLICDRYAVPLIVNDRIHLAVLGRTAGVHLGQGDLKTEDARALLGAGQWVGRSTHAMEEAEAAAREGVDYIGVGPLYLTKTKEHRHAVGLSYLESVERDLEMPYVGIGAVNREHWEDILSVKPKGLAICTAIIGHEDPEGETRFYKQDLAALWGESTLGPEKK